MVALSPVLGATIVKDSGGSDTKSSIMLKKIHCVRAPSVKVSDCVIWV